MATIKIPAIKSTVSVTNHKITYIDGVVIELSGSNTIARRKEAYLKAVSTPPVIQPPVEPPKTVEPSNFRVVGNGSGQLDLGNISNDKIKIKAGNYSSIKIGLATDSIIEATGVSTNGMDIQRFNGLDLLGLSFSKGGIYLVNPSSKLNLSGSSFEAISGDVIRLQNQPLYSGGKDQICEDWKIQGCNFNNTGSVFSCGSISKEGIKGLVKNFSFAGNTIKDKAGNGSVLFMGAVDGYKVENNTMTHVNYGFGSDLPTGYHNGVFHMVGNGLFKGNKGFDCQGNFIRAWNISFNPEVGESEFDNNIYYNSSKYGSFEIQVPPDLNEFIKASKGKYNYVNVKIHNNTAGKLGTSNTLWAQMLDAYSTYADVEYYDNIGFDMLRMTNEGKSTKDGITDMLVNFSGTPLKRNDRNLYFEKWEQAVENLTTFKSLHSGIGAL